MLQLLVWEKLDCFSSTCIFVSCSCSTLFFSLFFNSTSMTIQLGPKLCVCVWDVAHKYLKIDLFSGNEFLSSYNTKQGEAVTMWKPPTLCITVLPWPLLYLVFLCYTESFKTQDLCDFMRYKMLYMLANLKYMF